MTTATLPPPTVVDLIDAAVRASNNLLCFALAVRETDRETITHSTWDDLVEADYLLNTVQDSIREEHP